MRPPHLSSAETCLLPHLSTMQVQASLQKDTIPFGCAFGLSLITFLPAGSRLWGCWKMPKLSRWLHFTCWLSAAGSLCLFLIVVLKIYEKHQGPYLGLILVNPGILGSYEVYIANRIVILLLTLIRLSTSG